MLSEQKMSMKLLMIGAVLLIAAVKGEPLYERVNYVTTNLVFVFTIFYLSRNVQSLMQSHWE